MMTKCSTSLLALWVMLATPAYAGFPAGAVTACGTDAVPVATMCMDKYEASVWRVPNPTTVNQGLVAKIQSGRATAAILMAAGAVQLGVVTDDYAPCTDDGQNCTDDIYAASLVGVPPSADITWFQAQVACANSGKRLPSNAEWQMAVLGTPDPGPDNGTTDCSSDTSTGNTGSRSSCVSASGAYDMVGNIFEVVADWLLPSTSSLGWGAFSNDGMCFDGADTTTHAVGVMMRGGSPNYTALGGGHVGAGPLAVNALIDATYSVSAMGFRCAR